MSEGGLPRLAEPQRQEREPADDRDVQEHHRGEDARRAAAPPGTRRPADPSGRRGRPSADRPRRRREVGPPTSGTKPAATAIARANADRQHEGGLVARHVVDEPGGDRGDGERQAREQPDAAVVAADRQGVDGEGIGERLPRRLEDPERHEQDGDDDRRPGAEQRARPRRPPPIAHTWSVRGRPSRTSARCPHAGTARVKPTAPIEAISPISAGPKPRSCEDDRDERVEDPERRAEREDERGAGRSPADGTVRWHTAVGQDTAPGRSRDTGSAMTSAVTAASGVARPRAHAPPASAAGSTIAGRSAASTSRSAAARCSGCSDPTAPARRRPSACSPR